MVDDLHVLVFKLFHYPFDLELAFDFDRVLLLLLVYSDCKDVEHRRPALLHPLVEEAHFEDRRLFEVLFLAGVLVQSGVRVLDVLSGFRVPLLHFDLDAEQQSHLLWVESHVMGRCQLHELGHLALLVVLGVDGAFRFLAGVFVVVVSLVFTVDDRG